MSKVATIAQGAALDSSRVYTEADFATKSLEVSSDLAVAERELTIAELRHSLFIGLREVAHPDAARFADAEKCLVEARQRVSQLRQCQEGLRVGAGYCAMIAHRRRLADLAPLIDAAHEELLEYTDVEGEDQRREIIRLQRIMPGGLKAPQAPLSPDQAREFPRRRAAYLVAKTRVVEFDRKVAQEQDALRDLSERYPDVGQLLAHWRVTPGPTGRPWLFFSLSPLSQR
jgi:hypothetical protein